MTASRFRLLCGILLLAAFAFDCAMHAAYFPTAPDGVHLHVFDSDIMMQTLPAAQLKKTPIQTLWYDHIQPPMLDAIRALILRFTDAADDRELLLKLDRRLYVVWAGFYAAIALLVFLWTRGIAGSLPVALAAWVAWVVHPAPLLYSTFLETTLLSSLLVTWLLYGFWKRSWPQATAAVILLFYTRTVYQWYFLAVLLLACALAGWGWTRTVKVAACCVVFAAPLVLKQYLLFDMLDTTTFSGYHATGVLWYAPSPREVEERRARLSVRYPAAADAYSGGDPYNTRAQYEDNIIHKQLAAEKVRDDPVWAGRQLLRSLVYNGVEYWGAPARFLSGNLMVNSLPWKGPYDFVFGRRCFPLVLLLALGLWAHRTWRDLRRGPTDVARLRLRAAAALGLLVGYTVLVTTLSNRLNWTEALRLKMLLEPTYYVFAITQLYLAARAFLADRRPVPAAV